MRITAAQGSTFIDRMIKLVEGAERQKTPNEIALNILLAGLTIIFVFATVTIPSYAAYAGGSISVVIPGGAVRDSDPDHDRRCCPRSALPAWTGLVRFNVLAMSGRAVEAAGDVDTLLLDKTGTITLGNRQATAFRPVRGVTEQELADAAQLASLADETPKAAVDRAGEGEIRHPRPRHEGACRDLRSLHRPDRMSGIDAGSSSVRKGAVDAILNYIGGGTAQSMASGNRARALQPAVNSDARASSRSLPMKSPRMAVRRSQSRKTAACSASFTSRTSSRAASASALPNCAAWASAP